MKSYSHLFEQYISRENYLAAVRSATAHKGGKKRKYRKAAYLKEHKEELMPGILEYAANFRNEAHTPQKIYDGIQRKQRTITVPSMREQVVHHMIINVMKPIMLKPMYEHSYGSIPGRGATKGSGRNRKATRGGKEAVEKFIRKHPRDCKYCLKMDIRKYFESVPRAKLTAMLRRIIRDERFIKVLETLVEFDGAERGIPIGFYTSQWFANFYLTGLDHYIKEKLGARGYFRYMDDMVVFGGNKRKLHRIREAVERYLNEELGLELNPKWQVFLFHWVGKDGKEHGRFLDFMGFRFYRNKTTLRRALMLKATRKARRIARKDRKTVYDCRQMLSYKGWISAANVYGMYRKRIKPYVSFRSLRLYESKCCRKAAEEERRKSA